MRKVLLVGSIESPFLFDKILELSDAPGIQFDCFDTELCRILHVKELRKVDEKHFSIKKRAMSRMNKRIKILLSIPLLSWLILSRRYYFINIYSAATFYTYFSWLFAFSSTRLLLLIFGSDFNYASDSKRAKFRFLFHRATYIIFTNALLLEKFNGYYHQEYTSKLKVCRVGLPVLKFIDKCRLEKESYKDYFKFPANKISVICGAYGDANNNHLKILEELMKIKDRLSREIHIVIPYTYGGNQGQLKAIKDILSGSSYTYTILTDFLSLEGLAKLRLATDIFIHLPNWDQFSGTMQETLYAGGVVITGSWLPYELLDKQGAIYFKITGFNELPQVISDLVGHPELSPEQKEKNKNVIYELSSWEIQKRGWLQLYNS